MARTNVKTSSLPKSKTASVPKKRTVSKAGSDLQKTVK